jgi:hypothetical protein
VLVGEDLDLHMAWPLEEPLQVDTPVTERLRRLALRRPEGTLHLGGASHHAHAAATAARGGLEQDRVPDGRGGLRGLFHRADRLDGARHHRHPDFPHALARRRLVPHRRDGRGGRADEGESGGRHRLREVRPLGKEAVAWMHRVCAGLFRGVEELLDVEV